MKLLTKIILLSLLISPLSCFNDEDDCYYFIDTTTGISVIGAGSNQYNGDYVDIGIINNYYQFEKAGTVYTIEFDLLYDWCIKDNGVIQYYAPGCQDEVVYKCNSFIVLNGDPPAPTLERSHYYLPAKCGM
jgi:hypothetical protein